MVREAIIPAAGYVTRSLPITKVLPKEMFPSGVPLHGFVTHLIKCNMQNMPYTSQTITGQKFQYSYEDKNRIGGHIWYISDLSKFKNHYPQWKLTYGIKEIFEENKWRWGK